MNQEMREDFSTLLEAFERYREKMEEENKRLREALAFYADERNYLEGIMTVTNIDKLNGIVTFGDGYHYGYKIGKDSGARARAALEGK